ncbi:hypothetical protein [Herbaspirillum rubrisubalbicans]|nr:hypothetical protein [Herbaspirillum rubrisubalbicans]
MTANRRLIYYVDVDLARSDAIDFNAPLLSAWTFAFSWRSSNWH